MTNSTPYTPEQWKELLQNDVQAFNETVARRRNEPDLRGVDLRGIDLQGANLEGVAYSTHTIPPSGVDLETLGMALAEHREPAGYDLFLELRIAAILQEHFVFDENTQGQLPWKEEQKIKAISESITGVVEKCLGAMHGIDPNRTLPVSSVGEIMQSMEKWRAHTARVYDPAIKIPHPNTLARNLIREIEALLENTLDPSVFAEAETDRDEKKLLREVALAICNEVFSPPSHTEQVDADRKKPSERKK